MITLLLLTAQVAAPSQYDFAGNPANPGPAARGVAGTILGTINGPSTSHTGAAFDGTNLLLTHYLDGSPQIYVVDPVTGATLSTVTILDQYDFGLGYDALRSLYITTNASSDFITTFDGGGVLQNQWYVGGGPVGAAHDSTRDVYWIVDWSANTVYSMDPLTGGILTTWSTSAVGCTRGAGVAYDAASDTLLVGGRDQDTIFVMDPNTGGLVNSWLANDGGNNPQGLGVSASGSVWQSSGNSSLLTEFDLGGPSGPTLTLTGTCPGLVTFDVTGSTPFGGVAVVYGAAGSFTLGGGACAGLTLGIGAPNVAGVFAADVNGDVTFSANIPSGACGLSVQAVDIGACEPTNAAVL